MPLPENPIHTPVSCQGGGYMRNLPYLEVVHNWGQVSLKCWLQAAESVPWFVGTAFVERNRIPCSILSPPGPETCFQPRGDRK